MPTSPIPTIGISRCQLVVPATTATPDYSDGDTVGGLLTFTDFSERSSGVITNIHLRSSVNIGVDTFLHLFNANPSASTFTDNAAISIHADDKDMLFHTLKIVAADWVAHGAALYRVTKSVLIPFELAAGATMRNLYAALETDGTINLGSTTDLAVWIGGDQN